MKKIILIPDSFKGTLSSEGICHIMEEGVRHHYPQAQVISIPVADGGEGSVDCFLAAVGGEKVDAEVTGVFGKPMRAAYGLIDEGRTAVIEMAACAGLPLAEGDLNPGAATTYGVGELMLDAARRGVNKIIMGLGGSATNDGGCGCAAACGVVFKDDQGRAFMPTGYSLKDIAAIETDGLDPLLKKITITVMCDIDNPMYGKYGAAYIFGPQKGADAAMVKTLDAGLEHLNNQFKMHLEKDFSALPGGGAAGAMGAGMAAFFGAELQMGIDTVLDTVGYDDLVRDATLVFSGEGQIDGQSLGGKVVVGVARRTAPHAVPLIAVVGTIADDFAPVYDEGVTAVFSINTKAMDFAESRYHSADNLAITMDNILRLAKGLGV